MTHPEDAPVVERLRIYPVKGCRGHDVSSIAFDEIGPVGDRRWMVVDPEGVFVTQRQSPRLALIDTRAEGSALSLSAEGRDGAEAEAPLGDGQPSAPVQIWRSRVDAVRAWPEADAWLSDHLERPCHLVYMPASSVRATDPEFAPGRRVSFADGYPAHLVTSAAVAELARRAGSVIPVERFRPNIVVGPAHPHAEDRWRALEVGDMAFQGVKLCARCKVTTVDQSSGALDPASEPLRSLARYRQIEGSVYFGLNLVHEGSGQIRVGDPVRVTDRRPVPTG
jgi:uncharacterized protein YcbX